jgi:uncharacterized protein
MTVVSAVSRHTSRIAALCREYGVRRLCLFGSAAGGKEGEAFGDVDLLVQFDELGAGRYADAYFGLLESLEGLLGRPIDLVEEDTIDNPYLKRSVDGTKVLLYERA